MRKQRQSPRYEYLNRFRDKIRTLEALIMTLPERPKQEETKSSADAPVYISTAARRVSASVKDDQPDYFFSMLESFLRGAGIPSGKLSDLYTDTPVMVDLQDPAGDYSLMNLGAAQKILMAKKDGAVYLIASPWDTLTKDIVNAIKVRPDVSIAIKYTGKDGKVKLTFIHANKDISGFINEQGGLDLNRMRSVTVKEVGNETF